MCLNSAVRNLYVHKRVELCENALECEHYLPKERGTLSAICVNRGDRNLLWDQEPIVCLYSGAKNLLSA